jgi:hypothetical protein
MPAGDPILAADYALIRKATIDLIVCRVSASGTQTLASGGVAINFSVEDFDPYNIHAAGTPSRITPAQAGYYRFEGGAYYGSTAAVCATWLRKNGVTNIPSGQREGTTAAANARGQRSGATVYMNGTTDYMELMGDPSAATITNQSAQFSSWLECWFTGRVTNP